MVRTIPEGLIVSCQALKDEPLYGGNTIAKMAQAVMMGGAVAIRSNSIKDINAIDKKLNQKLPIIGLIKKDFADSEIYITPTLKEVKQLLKSRCDVIALDATLRKRPHGETLEELVQYIRDHSDKLIMADIATIEEAKYASQLGFDFISSTLHGYTKETTTAQLPDINFLRNLIEQVHHSKIVAEGGIQSVDQLNAICTLGYKHVVIGSAITRPQLITKMYVSAFVK